VRRKRWVEVGGPGARLDGGLFEKMTWSLPFWMNCEEFGLMAVTTACAKRRRGRRRANEARHPGMRRLPGIGDRRWEEGLRGDGIQDRRGASGRREAHEQRGAEIKGRACTVRKRGRRRDPREKGTANLKRGRGASSPWTGDLSRREVRPKKRT